MAYLLHIETATDICSVAISHQTKILALQEDTEGFSHAAKITLLIQAALSEASIELRQIGAVSISKGPGSYTALRIGSSTAKGICYAQQIPLIAVDTLQALAQASTKEVANPNALFFPMIDARRMEVYTAGYDVHGNEIMPLEAKIIDETSFDAYLKVRQILVFSGNGAPKCQPILNDPFYKYVDMRCCATHLVPLAWEAYQAKHFEDIAYFTPTYFKAPHITTPKKVL